MCLKFGPNGKVIPTNQREGLNFSQYIFKNKKTRHTPNERVNHTHAGKMPKLVKKIGKFY